MDDDSEIDKHEEGAGRVNEGASKMGRPVGSVTGRGVVESPGTSVGKEASDRGSDTPGERKGSINQ